MTELQSTWGEENKTHPIVISEGEKKSIAINCGPKELPKKKWSDYSWVVFPVFIFWLIGVAMGIWGAKQYFEHKLNDAIAMKRMIYQSIVYDIMLYDKTGK